MRSFPLVPAGVVMLVGVVALGVGCGDSDVEEGCTSGACGGGPAASTSTTSASTSTSSGGVGGGDGGGGGAPPVECEPGETGDLPCEVFTILEANCHRCHTEPPANGAPFPLLTWEHFQADYFGKPVWERAEAAIQPDAIPRMPFGEDPLPEETRAVLEAWFATCHEGECAHADE